MMLCSSNNTCHSAIFLVAKSFIQQRDTLLRFRTVIPRQDTRGRRSDQYAQSRADSAPIVLCPDNKTLNRRPCASDTVDQGVSEVKRVRRVGTRRRALQLELATVAPCSSRHSAMLIPWSRAPVVLTLSMRQHYRAEQRERHRWSPVPHGLPVATVKSNMNPVHPERAQYAVAS